jgi:hypothetical protein
MRVAWTTFAQTPITVRMNGTPSMTQDERAGADAVAGTTEGWLDTNAA